MELIQSFSVDHTRIIPGIFTSREDNVGGSTVTTYDIRLKRPNREPVIDVAAMHSLEHSIGVLWGVLRAFTLFLRAALLRVIFMIWC